MIKHMNYLKLIASFTGIGIALISCTDLEVEEMDSIVTEGATGEFSGDAGALLRQPIISYQILPIRKICTHYMYIHPMK